MTVADKWVFGSAYHKSVECPQCDGTGRVGKGLLSSGQTLRSLPRRGEEVPQGQRSRLRRCRAGAWPLDDA